MSKKNETKEKILVLAFQYLNEVGWNNFSYTEFSKKKKINIERVNFFFEDKTFLLKEFISFIDEQVIKELANEKLEKDQVKDNIFEVLMIRFEKLQPYKKGLKSIFPILKKRPKLLNAVAQQLFSSMDLVLEISMAKKGFIFNKFALNGLFLIYVNAFNLWLDDDSSEMNKTMARLDLLLSRSEFILNKIKI